MPYRVVTGHRDAVHVWPDQPGQGKPMEVCRARFFDVFGVAPPSDGEWLLLRFRIGSLNCQSDSTLTPER